MTKTLLEKAKALKSNKINSKITDEDIDLVHAWSKGEITLSQIGHVKKIERTNVQYWVYHVLRECFKDSRLVLYKREVEELI